MFYRKAVLAALAALATAGPASAQWVDYDAYIRDALRRQDEIFQGAQQQADLIVQQLMAEPIVQNAYQHAWDAGFRGSFDEYAYGWAATRGYTREGIAYFNAIEAQNAANEHAALRGYRQAQANFAAAIAAENTAAGRRSADVGMLLGGYTMQNTPGGPQWGRSNGNGTFTGPNGNQFGQASNGQWYSSNNQGGSWQPM